MTRCQGTERMQAEGGGESSEHLTRVCTDLVVTQSGVYGLLLFAGTHC